MSNIQLDVDSIMKLPIDTIVVQDRFRKDLGDVKALAESIKKQGLLQPIGVTEDNRLVFGGRRLKACGEILGWSEIDVRIVNVTSIVEGEHDENEVRKDFTASERVEIGRAVERVLGERQGQRSDQLRDNCPTVDAGRSRDIAARKAGFGSGKTYERAKAVVDRGIPQAREAMDSGKLSIAAAETIAKQKPEEQARILSFPVKQQRQAVRDVRRTEEMKARDAERSQANIDKSRQAVQKILTTMDPDIELIHLIRVLEEVACFSTSGHRYVAIANRRQRQRLSELAPRTIALLNDIQEAQRHVA